MRSAPELLLGGLLPVASETRADQQEMPGVRYGVHAGWFSRPGVRVLFPALPDEQLAARGLVMHASEFLDLLQSFSRKRNAEVWARITAAIAADPGIVVAAWSPAREGWAEVDFLTWGWLFQAVGYRENGAPAVPPPGPTRLFRGCIHPNRFGMSWSPSYALAHEFALKDGADRPQIGNVYECWSPAFQWLARIKSPDWMPHRPGFHSLTAKVVSFPSGKYVWAPYDEVIVDPRGLNDDNVFPVSVAPTNYAAMMAEYAAAGRPTDFEVLISGSTAF